MNDAEKRQQYDTYGSVGTQSGREPGFNPFKDGMWDLGDIFGGRRARNFRGQDMSRTIKLTFMESVLGCSKSFKVSYPQKCKSCDGNGADKGKALETCNTCGGQGKVGQSRGFMQVISTCPSCRGAGYSIVTKCSDCNGSGKDFKESVLKVNIPAGIDNGMSMRLAGKGMPGEYGAENGDLYVSIIVAPHKEFSRSDLNIISEKEVDYTDAILGTNVPVNTIYGKLTMKVPPGTQPESLLRISGKGIKQGGKNGDHLVRIKVKLPKKLSKDEKELLNKLKGMKAAK